MKDYIKSLEPMGWCVTILDKPDFNPQLHIDCYNRVIREIEERYIPVYNSDLVEVSTVNCCCSECAKYQGRIYSLYGKDPRFPRFPDWLINTKGMHCSLYFYPFIYGISHAAYVDGDVIRASNRPFIDDRSQECIENYERIISEYKDEMYDRNIYPQLAEKCPDSAPKTYGAYRRMKKQKSKGYLKLAEEAKKVGIELPL